MPMVLVLYHFRSIGSASTNPIIRAIRRGYSSGKPIKLKIDKPTRTIIKDMKIIIISAFKYPPKLSFIFLVFSLTFPIHFLGK